MTYSHAMSEAERQRRADIDANRHNYVKAQYFLTDLRYHWRKRHITSQQYSTLRGQAVHGDLDGAVKGLATLLK